MNKSLLFPHWCQKTGWWILGAVVVFCVLMSILASINPDYLNWMQFSFYAVIFLPSLALFLICLSQEKLEDEYIAHIRARSIFYIIIVIFVICLITYPIKLIGSFIWSPSQMGAYMSYVAYFKDPFIITFLYLVIFKGTLFINSLKTRNDDGQ